MKLLGDIKSRRWLHAKGLLFLATGVIATGLLLMKSPDLTTFFLVIIIIWSFCRFYYFLFYVLEKYAGRDRKYAGLLDALKYLLRGREK